MNLGKFNSAFADYLKHCEISTWIKDESYKFYFANWIIRKVNLAVQPKETILRHCKDALKKDYSLDDEVSKIGVNFLQKSGREKLSVAIELSDVEIAQYLMKNEIPDEGFFKKRGTSYPALGAWLGTLLPKKFVPIGTSDFHETVSYLFDLENFPQSGYQFFIDTQKYFHETKAYLKQHNLDHLFLPNIIQYLAQEYPNVEKKKYDEVDWNWITQDFHLFIFRKYLHDIPFKAEERNKKQTTGIAPTSNKSIPVIEKADGIFSLEIHIPQEFDYESNKNELSNRNLQFDKDHYLKKYQTQLEKGSWAEQIVFNDEVAYLIKCNKSDLSDQVEIVSTNPDYGYDILSYETDGTKKQIEVKSINSDNPKSFFITANELRKSTKFSNYYIYCVLSNGNEVQKIYRLKRPDFKNDKLFRVIATNYEVCFM